MKCWACDDEENWHSFDTPEKKINKKRELLCCKNCGAVTYRVDPENEEKMRDYYRHEYRPMPNHMNLVTTTHKLNYVKIFLADFLKDKKDLVIADIGCATGYLVNYFRQEGHKATGCEYTVTYRRFSEHFYGIPISEELDPQLRFDLISIYHVLEHMVEPDKKLEKYVELLKDDGHLIISTPEWYNTLEEASGPPITSFENLWHKDHINVFSYKSITNVFKKLGLEIVKEDRLTYGMTFLLKKGAKRPIEKENPDEVIKRTWDAYHAIAAYLKNDFKEAVRLWPKFPDAWARMITEVHGKDPERQSDLFDEAVKAIGDNKKMASVLAVWHYTYGRYDAAIKTLDWLCSFSPDEERFLLMGYCYMCIGDPKTAIQFFYKAAEMNPTRWAECMDKICIEAAKMPAWDERAVEKMKVDLEKNVKPKIRMVDPMFKDLIKSNGNGHHNGTEQAPEPEVKEPTTA